MTALLIGLLLFSTPVNAASATTPDWTIENHARSQHGEVTERWLGYSDGRVEGPEQKKALFSQEKTQFIKNRVIDLGVPESIGKGKKPAAPCALGVTIKSRLGIRQYCGKAAGTNRELQTLLSDLRRLVR